jgi:hypothetical protein
MSRQGGRDQAGLGFGRLQMIVGTGFGPMACVAFGPHGPPPAPMSRSRASPGSDARHWSPDVILGFAEYALLSHIYLPVFLSLCSLDNHFCTIVN